MDEKAMAMVGDGLLDVEAAAAFLGIRRSKLYALMEQGEIPYCKLGRSRRIPKRALMAYAAANLRGGWALRDVELEQVKPYA